MVNPIGFNKVKALGNKELAVKLVLCGSWDESDMGFVPVRAWLVSRFGWLWIESDRAHLKKYGGSLRVMGNGGVKNGDQLGYKGALAWEGAFLVKEDNKAEWVWVIANVFKGYIGIQGVLGQS